MKLDAGHVAGAAVADERLPIPLPVRHARPGNAGTGRLQVQQRQHHRLPHGGRRERRHAPDPARNAKVPAHRPVDSQQVGGPIEMTPMNTKKPLDTVTDFQ